MKIAIVLNTSWNIYNFRMNFVKALIAKGHEVHTVAPHDSYSHYLTEIGCHHHDLNMDSRGANLMKDLWLTFGILTIYRRIKPDVVLHYTIKPNVYGTLAAAILRIPSINNVCGLGTIFLKENWITSVALALYKVAFKFPKKVFFQNPDDRSLFIHKRLIKSEFADLLPGSGVDLSHFSPREFKRNKEFTFLLISRLIIDKGIYEYIEAIRLLNSMGIKAKFQMLGPKDPDHKRGIKVAVIDQWIKEGIIDYLGVSSDVRPFMQQADCIVLPSYREGTPRTLLEAASISKPIITTDVPGCNHIVTDGYNGLLCKLKNANDLASKMKTMATYNDDTLKTMGINGRKKAEREFDELKVIDRYMDAIRTFTSTSVATQSIF